VVNSETWGSTQAGSPPWHRNRRPCSASSPAADRDCCRAPTCTASSGRGRWPCQQRRRLEIVWHFADDLDILVRGWRQAAARCANPRRQEQGASSTAPRRCGSRRRFRTGRWLEIDLKRPRCCGRAPRSRITDDIHIGGHDLAEHTRFGAAGVRCPLLVFAAAAANSFPATVVAVNRASYPPARRARAQQGRLASLQEFGLGRRTRNTGRRRSACDRHALGGRALVGARGGKVRVGGIRLRPVRPCGWSARAGMAAAKASAGERSTCAKAAGRRRSASSGSGSSSFGFAPNAASGAQLLASARTVKASASPTLAAERQPRHAALDHPANKAALRSEHAGEFAGNLLDRAVDQHQRMRKPARPSRPTPPAK